MERAAQPAVDAFAQPRRRFRQARSRVQVHIAQRGPARARIDIERCASRQLLATVGGDLDVGGHRDRLLGTPLDAFPTLDARRVRQRQGLPAGVRRHRLDRARGTGACAFSARRAAAEVHDRESKRCLSTEWIGLGKDARFQTLRDNAEHVTC